MYTLFGGCFVGMVVRIIECRTRSERQTSAAVDDSYSKYIVSFKGNVS
jgi:hypothetical protein